jgi:hypothetical protein
MSRSLTACLTLLVVAAGPALAAWDPQAFSKQQTLEFLTVGPEEGEHWSTVWLVVIDGQVYVRLGGRAADRIEKNTTKPVIKVRIAGQEFDHVVGEPAPDMVAAVNQAMSDKYWFDMVIHYFRHPLTLKLIPQ